MVLQYGPNDEDSVDAQFAGEYSEETRDLMRQHQKPAWMEPDSDLDPLEDMEEHIEHGMRIPPSTYDAAQQAATEQAANLRAAKAHRLEPSEQELVAYRKALVEGTNLDEIKLLKLRAYHRAMDEFWAKEAQQQTPEARRQLMEDYGVPLDKVPQDLIDMTPDQLAERLGAGMASSSGAAWAAADSEDSEWAGDWQAPGFLQTAAARSSLWAAFAGRPKAAPAAERPSEPDVVDEFGAVLLRGDPSKYKVWEPVHGYTPQFLEQQRLREQLKRQRRARAAAFWLPLSAVLGAYAVRTVRRMLSGRAAAAAAAKQSAGKKKAVPAGMRQ